VSGQVVAATWAERAACVGRDVEDFFTESRPRVREIKNLCAGCPVRRLCLDEAMRAEDTSRYGIYGGLTAAERTDLARGIR
jgi:WhiB family redox-sensing transcriptional regulator